jgi:hypothetical protein
MAVMILKGLVNPEVRMETQTLSPKQMAEPGM